MNDLVVVDDNPVVAGTLSAIFSEHGCTVRTASDGFAALAAIRERMPDILVSDLNMPRMSGFELLSIVRRRFPSIAVIAMSGAYEGVGVPQGVAADAFYAKGSAKIDRLFETLDAVENGAMRRSSRVAAPIWIAGVPMERGTLATIAIACPECLRTFPHCLRDGRSSHTEHSCPHCHQLVRLAIVRSTPDMDQTTLGAPGGTVRISVPAYIR